MKNIPILLAFLFLSQVIYGQKILSNVYAATSPGIILHGENNPMKYFQLELIQLAPNKRYKKRLILQNISSLQNPALHC